MKRTHKNTMPVAIKTIVLAMASAGLVSMPHLTHANPTGAKVVAGNVTISQESASKVGITQTTAKGIIDWQKYSIGANEHVQYYQPSASSVTLNRVVGQDPSQILGRLSANGQVFLVNPNGIYFGKNAQIDVAGLVASTHNIRNEDFLAGKYSFNIPGKPGAAVINEGSIRIADTGISAFVAPSVANRGVIVAKLGKVALASANGFTLDFQGDELLSFLVSEDVAKTAFDMDGKQLTSFVENSGQIEAQGGYVLLTAKAAESAIHGVINQSGVIEASTVGLNRGEIILNAGKGSLEVSGTLDASAPIGGDGGFIETSGAQLSLADNMVITTAAPYGKTGTWLVDPQDILVATGGASGFSSGTSLAFGSNPNSLTTIAPSLLNAATTNIVLEATRDIEFRDAVNVRQAGVGLTAKAGRDVKVNAEIKTNNGEINLLAGWDRTTNTPAVNDGIVDINGFKVDSGTAARNIIGRGPSTSGLVGYWDFNGDAKDGSGNGNNGTPSQSITFITDGSRQIAKFSGISNPGAIAINNNPTLQFNPDMTLAYWVRLDGTQGMDVYGRTSNVSWVNAIIAKSHDRAGFVNHIHDSTNGDQGIYFGNNVFRSGPSIGGLTGSTSLQAVGKWLHVAFTFTGTEAKMYLNGVLAKTETGTYDFSIANTENLYFGKFSDSWYPLNGALDEVRLYNQTLSSSRISEIYSRATPPVTPPAVNNPIISGSYVPTPKEEVFIASAFAYAFKNPITETGDVFDQFGGGKIKSKTGSAPINLPKHDTDSVVGNIYYQEFLDSYSEIAIKTIQSESIANTVSVAYGQVMKVLVNSGLASKVGLVKFINPNFTKKMAEQIYSKSLTVDFKDMGSGLVLSYVSEIIKDELKLTLGANRSTYKGVAIEWEIDQSFLLTQLIITGGTPLQGVVAESQQTFEYVSDVFDIINRQASEERTVAVSSISSLLNGSAKLLVQAELLSGSLDMSIRKNANQIANAGTSALDFVNDQILPNLSLTYLDFVNGQIAPDLSSPLSDYFSKGTRLASGAIEITGYTKLLIDAKINILISDKLKISNPAESKIRKKHADDIIFNMKNHSSLQFGRGSEKDNVIRQLIFEMGLSTLGGPRILQG